MNKIFFSNFDLPVTHRMEESISNSRIQLLNTSSSYAQYLESLPNNYTREYDKIAQIVLKASKYLLNNNCKKCVIIDFILLNELRIIMELCVFCFFSFSFRFVHFDYRIGIDDKKCVEAISTYELPKTELLDQCEQLNEFEANINSYRRLLPAYYADGLSKVKKIEIGTLPWSHNNWWFYLFACIYIFVDVWFAVTQKYKQLIFRINATRRESN